MKGEWVRNPGNSLCIVFVHGFLSDGDSCWRNQIGAYWPELLTQEPSLQSLGVYVFTYQTSLFSGSYRLSDVVDALKEHMRLDGVIACREIVFVCHSLGGIVVRKFLIERASELIAAQKHIGLFLVASPSLGSSYADWLSPLARFLGHSQGDALRFVRGNEWLGDLDKEFRNLKERGQLRITGKELIEDKFILLKSVMSQQVVEPFSGARYFGESFKVPESDHFSIAKPESNRSIQHRLLCDFVTTFSHVGQPQEPVIDVGTTISLDVMEQEVEALHYSPNNARVRFTVTNLTSKSVKLSSLQLEVQEINQIKKFRLPTVGAPLPEFELRADISEDSSVDLLVDSRSQFILKPNESDAFSLIVTAKQGFRYHATLDCGCEIIGRKGPPLTSSQSIVIVYPIRTIGE
jgi:hypothetical protein